MDFSQFVSDLLSTIIGVGLALWGAIWLDRRTHTREREAQSKKKVERARRVLRLLRDELLYDSNALSRIDDNIMTTFAQLKIESWQAFSDGGELRAIDDPELLASISSAYALIGQFTFLYSHFFQMKFFPPGGGNSETSRILVNYTLRAKQDALEAVKNVLNEIQTKLPDEAKKLAA